MCLALAHLVSAVATDKKRYCSYDEAAQDAQRESRLLLESSRALLADAAAAEEKLQQLQQDMEFQGEVCSMLESRIATIPASHAVCVTGCCKDTEILRRWLTCPMHVQEMHQEVVACLKLAAQHMNGCLAAQSAASICEERQQVARQKSQLFRSRSMQKQHASMRRTSDDLQVCWGTVAASQ
jgi:hypothetical protein